MATYHVRMSVGNGGKAAAHFKYIERTGKYRRNDKLYSESGHLPSWASSPRDFWERTGEHDRRSYREIEFALPNELSREEQKKIVDDFIRDYLPDKAYTYAIHEPRSRLSDEKNPHVHIMFSERIIDDRTRDMSEEDFFKRYGISRMGNEYGGSIKDRQWAGKSGEPIRKVRQEIADRINEAYERNGFPCRVSAKSIEEQKREHYRAGDIEGGLLYKRARPFRAPTESFVRHVGEIAAAGRGEFNPEELSDPAARLRACQEREKVIVREIVEEIASRNAALEPTLEEDCAGTARTVEKMKTVVDSFDTAYRNTEICRWYEEQLRRLQALLAKQREAAGEPSREKKPLRDFSIVKAENRLLPSPSDLPEASPEETIRALYDVYLVVREKEKEQAGRTMQAFLEEETDRRTGGRMAAINQELDKLSYTFRPKAEKEKKQKAIEEQKKELIRAALSPADIREAGRLHEEAETERWKYIKIMDRLEERMSAVMKESGMEEEQAAGLFRAVEAERAGRKETKETDRPEAEIQKFGRSGEPEATTKPAPQKEAEPVQEMPAKPARTEEEKTAARPVPQPETARNPKSPDMRMLQRSIADAERTIARAEKKIAELHSRTETERLEARVDQITGGRLSALDKAREEELRRMQQPSSFVLRKYDEEKNLLMRVKATPAVRTEVREEMERDARRVRGLAKYVRREQGDIMRWRSALTALQQEQSRNEKQARLNILRNLNETDFLRHAVNEMSFGGLARLEKQRDAVHGDPDASEKAIRAAESACEAFYQTRLTPAVKARAAELAVQNQAERQKLAGEIERLTQKMAVREPFVSRYREQRERLLNDAARRRAFLYEETALKLSRRPNDLRYYCDEVINEKTDGLFEKNRKQYLRADEALRRLEAEKKYVIEEGRETLTAWKEVWVKPPLKPMKGRGRPIDAEALKKKRQTAEAAVTLLRKDYNVPEIWKEARRRLTLKQLDQQRRRDAIRQLKERMEKDRRRKRLAAQTRAALNQAARLVDRLLGDDRRGNAIGANLRISYARDNDLQGN